MAERTLSPQFVEIKSLSEKEKLCLICPLLSCDELNPACAYRKLTKRTDYWRDYKRRKKSAQATN